MTTESKTDNFKEFEDQFQCISKPKKLDREADYLAARRGVFHQVISTCAVLLLSAACGMPIGYSAVLLPQLTIKSDESIANSTVTFEVPDIPITVEMGSWIASVHSLATPVGSFISGPLADSIGRRTTLLIAVIPTFIGWCVLAMSRSFPMIIIGRLLCGFSTGIMGGPAQVYIAETTEPNLRSLLIGAPVVSYSLGILIVYALGSLLHWRSVAWYGNILPALAGLAIFCIPESPAWLLRNNLRVKAHKSLTFLRGNEIVAQKELNEMSEHLASEHAAAPPFKENIFELCCKRAAIKPLFIVIVFCFLQMFSGTFIVVFYAIDIIAEFGAEFDPRTAAIWTAVVRTLCTMICCVVLLIVRRRRMLLVSCAGSGLSCLVLSIFMYSRVGATKTNMDVVVAGTCLLTYIAFNTTLMVMPGIMVGELFPAKIRGRTAGGVFAAMNISLFGLTKAFPLIQSIIRMRGVFMLFAVASFAAFFFLLMFQPETKGKSLAEIEDYFNENNWLWFKRDKGYKEVRSKELNDGVKA